jgi:hypothetical protein
MVHALTARTYSVNNHCAEHSRGNRFAVLGVFSRAHDGVVAGGEHGTEGAEDDDGEDGDDDAVVVEGVSLIVQSLSRLPLHICQVCFLPRCLRRTMSMR